MYKKQKNFYSNALKNMPQFGAKMNVPSGNTDATCHPDSGF
jgi:hypothetical protein